MISEITTAIEAVSTATARRSCLAYGAGEAGDEQGRECPCQEPENPARRGQPGGCCAGRSLVRSQSVLAALVPGKSKATLIDPVTSLTQDVTLPAPYQSL